VKTIIDINNGDEMKQRELEKWEKFRKNGKKSYVLKVGVLYWGVFTAIMWSVIMHYMQPQETWYIRPLIALVLFPVGGIFFGLWTWKINEKKYRDALKGKK
jgi:hypothetical protein